MVWTASIIEAILHDFHLRIRANRHEGVNNLSYDIISYIRGNRIDEFEKYIVSAQKHYLFGEQSDVYERLHLLRKIRNRIHIQNKNFSEPKDESLIFRESTKELAEKCAEIVIKTMSRKYGRPISTCVEELCLSWEEHFPSIQGKLDWGKHELLGLI